eukprot:s681_g15.t2
MSIHTVGPRVKRFDEVFPQGRFASTPIDFVKIDVEGFECKVFQGAHELLSPGDLRYLAPAPRKTRGAGGMKRGAVCVLLLFLPVQAIVSRRQASNSSRPVLDPCACSCCAASQRSTGLSCVPRGDGCRLCAPGAVLQASFAALHNEVDYSRYCFAACQPLSSKEDGPCEERENSQETHLQTQLLRAPDAASAPAAAPAAAAPMSASELEHTGEVAAESLAEVALLRAQRHAREAKQSAALARYAYEKLAKSREEASEAAGQAALEDVILDARKDAGEAVKIRAGWEDAARAHAAQKAVVAAAVYKKAKLRDLQVAEAWDKQATLLLKTSRQYEEYAARQEMKEKKLKQALKKLEAETPETSALLQQGVAAPAPAPFRVEAPVLSKSLEPIPQVAQAPMAAFAPPPAVASGMVEGIAQAPAAAVAPPPASAMGPSSAAKAPSISSAAAPAPASAVEVEGSKKESKEENKEESKDEGKEEKSKEEKEKSKEEKEKSKEEKSKEDEEKSKKEGKEKSEETEAKAASTAVPVAPAPAASPSAASIASSAIFGDAKPAPLAPFGGLQDEKSRLLQELQVAEAQVDAGLKLAHEYELQAAAAKGLTARFLGISQLAMFDYQRAHAARKEAEGIRANASWYDGAEAAAAAHTLYAELPKGVIPPPLPALP